MCLGVLPISCGVYACVHASRSDPAQASVCTSVSACGDTCVPGAGWARLQVHTRGPVCVRWEPVMQLSTWGHTCLGLLLYKTGRLPPSTGPGNAQLALRLPLEKSTGGSDQGSIPWTLGLWCGCQLFLVPAPSCGPLCPGCSETLIWLETLRQVGAGGRTGMTEALPGSGCSSKG